MGVTSTWSDRFSDRSLIGAHHPLSQFQQLSDRISSQASIPFSEVKSPREEIYRSLIKQIQTNRNPSPKVGNLVRRASSILRLSYYKQEALSSHGKSLSKKRKQKKVSFSHRTDSSSTLFSGPTRSGSESDVALKTSAEKSNRNFVEIWDYLDNASSELVPTGSRPISRASEWSSISKKSSTENRDSKRPPWRYFGNQKGLSSPTPTVASYISTKPNANSTQSAVTGKPLAKMTSQTSLATPPKKPRVPQQQYHRKGALKRNCVRNVVAVRGQVVTFQGDGFENFTNWFGDANMLRKVVNRSSFRKELDLSGFSPQEIRLKLQEGHKLVIEAQRTHRSDNLPLRFKTTVILPQEVQVENLLLCRNPCGRLIIQDNTRPWTS